jgi:hypothetical protein
MKRTVQANFHKKTILQTHIEENEETEKLLKVKKHKPGKSVKYSMRIDEKGMKELEKDKDNMTSIANIRSSRSILKSEKHMNRTSQSQILSKSRHFLQKSKKKSWNINNPLEDRDDSDTS